MGCWKEKQVEMPLRDHFHPPLSTRRHWHTFHNSWATYTSSDLNRCLPKGYFAEANVQFNIEIDGAFPLITDIVEVAVYNGEGSPVLAGAIELVSPANKDRAAHRDAFISKCATYLQQGVGLVIVDVVTGRSANLHDELLARFAESSSATPPSADLYAAAYRPVEREGHPQLAVWPERLAIGQMLPTLPLWLRGALCLPVELEATYERTCREQRLLGNGN
jgi:hypothetical protein